MLTPLLLTIFIFATLFWHILSIWIWSLYSFIFQPVYISNVSTTFVEDSVFYPMRILDVFIKNQVAIIVWTQIQDFSSILLVYESVCVFLPCYCISRNLQYTEITYSNASRIVLFSLRACLAISGILWFHIHFEFCFVFLFMWIMALKYWEKYISINCIGGMTIFHSTPPIFRLLYLSAPCTSMFSGPWRG